ncbi:restriction endonuclease subunit S [Vreelandella titanicae]|uniref:restriction endonuclease subunit S n=1 Tax=Vreelandella titanicae TaxID=664683 RepID=UPI003FD844F1
MSYPAYPEYKDSGAEWLGKVPESWEVTALKWLSPVLRGASPRPIDDPIYFEEGGEFGWVRIVDVTASPDGFLYQASQRLSSLGASLSVKLMPNSLFLSIAGTVGKPCITKIKACIHDGFVYFPRINIDQRLLYRVFELGLCFGGLGKMGTQLNLNTETVGGIKLAVPPKLELLKILSFLDHETARIDALVEEQQRLIALLKEKRQAVISHAVTKGLDPDVPMKDSGVEWLGEVPEHWVCKRYRHATRIYRGKFGHRPRNDPSLYDGDFPFIQTGDIARADKKITNYTQTLNEKGAAVSQKFPSGSLVMAIAANIGDTAILDFEAFAPDSVVAFEPAVEVKLEFLRYSLNAALPALEKTSTQSTQANLNIDRVGSVEAVFPPAEEQNRIVKFLDRALHSVSNLEGEISKGLQLLQERRSALISAAVTGKIDVRSWEPPTGSAVSTETKQVEAV